MKRFFLFVLVFAAIFYSCSKEQDFNINYNAEKLSDIELPSLPNRSSTDTMTFNIAENPEIAENINQITSYSIKELQFSISDFIGNDTTTGMLSFYFINSSDQSLFPYLLSLDVNYADLAASGEKVNILKPQNIVDEMEAYLLVNNELTIAVGSGWQTDSLGPDSIEPVNFTGHISISVDAIGTK